MRRWLSLCGGWILASYVYSSVFLRSVLIVEGTVRAMGKNVVPLASSARSRFAALASKKTEFSGEPLCEVHCRQSKYILDECMHLRRGMRHWGYHGVTLHLAWAVSVRRSSHTRASSVICVNSSTAWYRAYLVVYMRIVMKKGDV